MSTRDSRYFQTLVFTSYIFKGFSLWRRISAFAVLVGFIGFLFLENYYGPKTFIKASAFATEQTTIFIQNFEFNERGLIDSRNYCKMSNCEAITCSSIPATHDPGNITSNFVQSIFKGECPSTVEISLIYKNCKFPFDTVQKDWLTMDLNIKELTFEGCSLNHIDDEAFSEKIFMHVERFSIFDNKISSFSRLIFSKFTKLNQLLIANNIIDYAESNLLANVANSLNVLQLDSAIKNSKVLRNITGQQILSNLESLLIQDNFLTILSPDLFAGIPKVRSLYSERSRIMEIQPNTFQSMAGSLEQLFLRGNQISTLPKGIFDSIILSSQRAFRVYLTQNIWHCDCELEWIQEFVKKYPSVIADIPQCTTPDFNNRLSFNKARFCVGNNPELTTTPNIKTTSEKQEASCIDENKVCALCDENISNSSQSSQVAIKSHSSVDYEFQAIFPNFALTELNDGTILVSLYDIEKSSALVWFDNPMQKDVQRSIYCVKNVKKSFLMKDTSPCTTYIFCLSKNHGFTPLNCKGIMTKPRLEDRSWLTNKYKPMVYLVVITLALLFCGISAFGMFIVLRRNPSLLRGSKRVVVIKHRKIIAMILPKGVELDKNEVVNEMEGQSLNKRPDTKSCTEDGYVTPLPPNRRFVRKDSRISRISFQSYGTGYVSGFEPTFCKYNRRKSEISPDEFGPPPLPPYPQRVVPSVSMAIDSVNAKDVDEDLNDTM